MLTVRGAIPKKPDYRPHVFSDLHVCHRVAFWQDSPAVVVLAVHEGMALIVSTIAPAPGPLLWVPETELRDEL